LHILVLEAYDGGSHKQFLDGLIQYSRHQFTRLSLPARKWKWRMRGSALYFAEQLAQKPSAELEKIDLVFTSDMTAGADLRALLPRPLDQTPLIMYFHENQLTYPVSPEDVRDYQYGFTNITSCLAAQAVWFNSRYHMENFLQAAKELLGKMPDFVPSNVIETISKCSRVMPLGLEPELFKGVTPKKTATSPTLLWNHRWEYDKNPDEFFQVLFDLDQAGIDFRLIVAGEQFREVPPVFETARKKLALRIDHFGFVDDRTKYLDLLRQADVVVSTAHHEFFGLAVLEAIAAGCYPLLPRRLSYLELIPAEIHREHLYQDNQQLRDKLAGLCDNGVPALSAILNQQVTKLRWDNLAESYDKSFEYAAGDV